MTAEKQTLTKSKRSIWWLLFWNVALVLVSVGHLQFLLMLRQQMLLSAIAMNFMLGFVVSLVGGSSLSLLVLIILLGQYQGELQDNTTLARWTFVLVCVVLLCLVAGWVLNYGYRELLVYPATMYILLAYCSFVGLATAAMIGLCYVLLQRLSQAMVC